MNTTRLRSYGNGKIIIAERVVLLRIKHLEHCRGWIAMNPGAKLVDFVQHHHTIARSRLADRLNDIARQRPDISAAVAADLGFVMNAA